LTDISIYTNNIYGTERFIRTQHSPNICVYDSR